MKLIPYNICKELSFRKFSMSNLKWPQKSGLRFLIWKVRFKNFRPKWRRRQNGKKNKLQFALLRNEKSKSMSMREKRASCTPSRTSRTAWKWMRKASIKWRLWSPKRKKRSIASSRIKVKSRCSSRNTLIQFTRNKAFYKSFIIQKACNTQQITQLCLGR